MSFIVKPLTLQGQHVKLAPIAMHHVDALFEIGQSKQDWAYLPITAFSQRAEAEHWVQQALALAEQGQHITFALIDPTTERLLGSTRYLNIRARDHGLEIGYTWLAPEAQRTAVNSETKYLLLRHAFESLDAYRVELKTDLRNLRSQRAIERLGARKEGILRRHMVTQGGYIRDSVLYSIVDQDWPAVRARLEAILA